MAQNCLIETMTYKTLKGYTYVVTASEAVTITDSNGLVLEVPAGEQRPFTASTTEVEYSAPCTITQVRGNFSLPSASGGGGQITIDPTPTQGSDNAVSSGGVFTALEGKADTSTLDGYLPLAEGVAPEVKGKVTFSGRCVFSAVLNAEGIKTTSTSAADNVIGGLAIGMNHSRNMLGDSHFGMLVSGNTRVAGFGVGKASLTLCTRGGLYTNSNREIYVDTFEIYQYSNNRHKAIITDVYSSASSSYVELIFGKKDQKTTLRGSSLELRICDMSDTTGASDTVLTLDAAKLQKLIDFLDTL